MMLKKMVFSVFVIFLIFGNVISCKADSIVGTTWVNQDNGTSFSFTNESQVVVNLYGRAAIPATYSVVDGTITITAALDSIIGKIDGNKIIITGELLEGEIYMKK
jgi:hypothetical protein